MDKNKVLKRDELLKNHTWDLKRLFKTEKEYLSSLEEVTSIINHFRENYLGKLTSSNVINQSVIDYMELLKKLTYVSTYQSLHSSVDQTNLDNVKRQGEFLNVSGEFSKKLSFYNSELKLVSDDLLNEAALKNNETKLFLLEIIKDKKHSLTPEQAATLSNFSNVLNAPYQNYNSFKFGDMDFGHFEIDGNKYEMSFSLFENNYESITNTNVRRKAYHHFYSVLKKYSFGFGNNYNTHLLKEKAYANLLGFDSVIDYLLYSQDVSRDMYDRQIDIIIEKLAPVMRRYVSLIKDVHKLDKLTYADLKLSIDPLFEPSIEIEESKKYMVNSLSFWGDDYLNMVNMAYDERWIDFPQNLGKSTGGFCSSPYQKGSYILLNWNYQMDEAFVLAHELGHAGHFYFAGENQNILNTRTSMYFIEAPSTMNEIIMGKYLIDQSDDLRFKRWVLQSLVSRTYYHNMVTHLLEAHFQREVYKLIDEGKPISTPILNNLKLTTLKMFWGDVVEIDDYASLTWMRQPHYFMGLYPYTYSAGLTISTATSKKLFDKTLEPEKWLDVLRAGGTKTPHELAMMVGVDLKTEKPLLDTINYIESLVDEIIEITNKLK